MGANSDPYHTYRDALPPRHKLTTPEIVTEDALFTQLMNVWKKQKSAHENTNGTHGTHETDVVPIYFHFNEKTYAVVMSQYKEKEHTCLPYIELSRCEMVKETVYNKNTDIPFEISLAMPYRLFELVSRNQVRIRQELGIPVLIEKLWGWGEKCTVHHVLSQNYFDVRDKSLKHPYLERTDLTEDQKRYMVKEFIDFLDVIRDVYINYEKRITISVLKI